jgi:hypothetical protein
MAKMRQALRDREAEALAAMAEANEAQALAEERLESIGHWKAANEEIQRERDEARAKLASGAALVERWTKRCAEWRSASRPGSSDVDTARAYEIAAAELDRAITASDAEIDEWQARAQVAQWQETSECWRRAHSAWQSWATELLDSLGRQPLHGEHGDGPAREVIAQLAAMAPGVPRCSNCGCFSTSHEVDDEERRECTECECKQCMVTETNESALAEIMRAGKERLKTIVANRESYVAAWIAETGLAPSECEIVEQHNLDVTVVFCRKREPAPYGHLSRANPDDEKTMSTLPETPETAECKLCRAVAYRVSPQCHIHGTCRCESYYGYKCELHR